MLVERISIHDHVSIESLGSSLQVVNTPLGYAVAITPTGRTVSLTTIQKNVIHRKFLSLTIIIHHSMLRSLNIVELAGLYRPKEDEPSGEPN